MSRGVALAVVLLIAGCAVAQQRRASVLDYLYPDGSTAHAAESISLDLPLSVGVAFVPSESAYQRPLTAVDEQRLLERVRGAFIDLDSVDRIEVVPSSFVTSGGGFENVRQIRQALGIEIIALVSYDQVQFDDPNIASITYWTIAGAYVIPGNENETHTVVDATVFDVESEALLFTASGQSRVDGRSTAVDLERNLRDDRREGFELAIEDLIPKLETALAVFEEQAKLGTVRGAGTPAVEITRGGQPIGGGVGSLGYVGLALGLLALAGRTRERR